MAASSLRLPLVPYGTRAEEGKGIRGDGTRLTIVCLVVGTADVPHSLRSCRLRRPYCVATLLALVAYATSGAHPADSFCVLMHAGEPAT